ncbi:hypothetical protein AAG570_012509 [Ranatra chinensis]|uniref:Uncharacterized protein n=1 Tax=Ranatra chinensis TaxID=642074 RepID=A0ABD0YEQ5_9HEMI
MGRTVTAQLALCEICARAKYECVIEEPPQMATPTPKKSLEVVEAGVVFLDGNIRLTMIDRLTRLAASYPLATKIGGQVPLSKEGGMERVQDVAESYATHAVATFDSVMAEIHMLPGDTATIGASAGCGPTDSQGAVSRGVGSYGSSTQNLSLRRVPREALIREMPDEVRQLRENPASSLDAALVIVNDVRELREERQWSTVEPRRSPRDQCRHRATPRSQAAGTTTIGSPDYRCGDLWELSPFVVGLLA